VISALILVAGWMVWLQSKNQAAAGAQQVEKWVQGTVRAAAEERELPPFMGQTEPVVRDALAAWVRKSVPESVALEVRVQTTPLRDEMLKNQGEATHRVRITLQERVLDVLVVWDGTHARAVGVEQVR
jgi:hypothetical protein